VKMLGSSIALEKIRNVLALLRKMNSHAELTAVSHLISLQERIRANSSSSLDVVTLFRPFLSVLNTPVLSEPFMLAAMDALNTFLGYDELFVGTGTQAQSISDALSDLIESLSHFRYVQTNYTSEELVPHYKIQILKSIMECKARRYLTNESLWVIIETFSNAAVKKMGSSGSRRQSNVSSHLAEESLYKSIAGLLIHASPNVSLSASDEPEMHFGLPCAMKVLSHFVRTLNKFVSKESGVLGRGDWKEVLVAINGIKAFLLGNGCISVTRNALIKCPSLTTMIRDDIGRYILLLASDRCLPSEVLEAILRLFSAMVRVIGPALKITIECFFQYIYLKALNQCYTMIDSHSNGSFESPVDSPKDGRERKFTIDEIEMVLESLTDIIVEPGFMVSLFMSFDCDCTKPDIVQQLWKYTAVSEIFINESNSHLANINDMMKTCSSLMIGLLSKEAMSDINSYRVEKSTAISYFSAQLNAKRILYEASQLFIVKPWHAFEFLVKESVMEMPLDPRSVATFLRISPWIPKDEVGVFLGKLGDEKSDNVSKNTKFHEDVLSAYVRSFKFSALDLVDCVRVFLSAFRLPGEAQQIDRILSQFASYCHECCNEGRQGIIENADVAFVLCFAIIMLNTDLHNQNIKAEKKMKKEEFVLYNKNYGRDVNQTKPLPDDFLEEIYESILNHPFRTERNDEHGFLTSEVWSDLQLNAVLHSRNGYMISTADGFENLSLFEGDSERFTTTLESIDSDITPSCLLSSLLSNSEIGGMHPITLSTLVTGQHSLLNPSIFHSVWSFIFKKSLVPLKAAVRIYELKELETDYTELEEENNNVSEDPSMIWRSIDSLVQLVKLAHAFEQTALVDLVMFVLADFSGALPCSNIQTIFDAIGDNAPLIFGTILEEEGKSNSSAIVYRLKSRLTLSVSARASMCTFLQIVHTNPSHLNTSWSVVFNVLGLLRDAGILPKSLVQDGGNDWLPLNARKDFDDMIRKRLRGDAEKEQEVVTESPARSKSGSFLSSIGEAIFGSNDELPSLHKSFSIRTDRWDDGYDDTSITNGDSGKNHDEKDKSVDSFGNGDDLTEVIAMCGIQSLVADTKFLNDESLLLVVRTIMNKSEKSSSTLSSFNDSDDFDGIIKQILELYESTLPHMSRASIAWLELLVVEIAIRNRDRFALLWPILSSHYLRSLGNTKEICVDYILERRVTGLLKIAVKMFSREHLTSSIIDVLQNAFVKDANSFDRDAKAKQRRFKDLAGHIISGTWVLLTSNAASLPRLQLDEWQAVFEIVEIAAVAGGYASVKAFEVMAWLLHEPRLHSEIPVFCIIAIKPLVLSNVPESVSIAAVQLLLHLHGRLDVLIDQDDSQTNSRVIDIKSQETPHLWEVCWYPILDALREGIRTNSINISSACLDGLSKAITDKHSEAVPVEVITRIVIEILVPVTKDSAHLLSGLIAKINADVEDESSTVEVMNHHDKFCQSLIRYITSLSETLIELLPRLAESPDILYEVFMKILRALGIFLLEDMKYGLDEEGSMRPSHTAIVQAAGHEVEGLLTIAEEATIFSSLQRGEELRQESYSLKSTFAYLT
jgi:hypothetical protein